MLERDPRKIITKIDGAGKQSKTSCDLSASFCDAIWRGVAGDLLAVEEGLRRMNVPCPGTSAGAKLYETSLGEHKAFLQRRVDGVKARIEESMARQAGDAPARWKSLWDEEESALPRICLSYGCSDW